MKITRRLLTLSILATAAIVYTGCKDKDDDSKTVEQQQLEKLAGAWNLVTATDAQTPDRTTDFTNLVLHLEGSYSGEGQTYNYNLTGTRPNPSPWPESGTWKFGTNKTSEIIRDPATTSEIMVNYSVADSELTLTFTVPETGGWPGGRVKSVTGAWTFTFSR